MQPALMRGPTRWENPFNRAVSGGDRDNEERRPTNPARIRAAPSRITSELISWPPREAVSPHGGQNGWLRDAEEGRLEMSARVKGRSISDFSCSSDFWIQACSPTDQNGPMIPFACRVVSGRTFRGLREFRSGTSPVR